MSSSELMIPTLTVVLFLAAACLPQPATINPANKTVVPANIFLIVCFILISPINFNLHKNFCK